MTGRGRPYIGRTIEIRIPDDVREALEAEAERNGLPLAAVARDILTAWARGGQQ